MTVKRESKYIHGKIRSLSSRMLNRFISSINSLKCINKAMSFLKQQSPCFMSGGINSQKLSVFWSQKILCQGLLVGKQVRTVQPIRATLVPCCQIRKLDSGSDRLALTSQIVPSSPHFLRLSWTKTRSYSGLAGHGQQPINKHLHLHFSFYRQGIPLKSR